eukprot:6566266-Ditylum_brightwellii.AAC.1
MGRQLVIGLVVQYLSPVMDILLLLVLAAIWEMVWILVMFEFIVLITMNGSSSALILMESQLMTGQ